MFRFTTCRSFGTKPVFDKLLVANRGEIANRIFATARRLGIKTVAVYSEADRFTKHVAAADEAVCIGPAPSSQSYLRSDKIIQACLDTGAQVVHPGYGFLSENAEFSAALEKHGIAFAGPGPAAVLAMGDKIESKKIASKAGVSVIPGFQGEVKSTEDVLRVAHEIGYPVMVKASAGGGGKGMRVAWNDEELLEGFRLSKQEAASSFGDDRMLIEKFIDNPRHIEIQVICDGQGTSLYFPERDCSVQRRNQKVLEESPSTFLDAATRKAMGEQAIALADAVGYKSAGTVEFICDSQRNFYFLEMNTRLQVEHPITEMVTGVDLVEHMIDVAAGRKLRLKQSDLGIQGHAFESRVYAEDPLRGYLPSIGRLVKYVEPLDDDVPSDLGTVRCDSGILEGSEVSIYYDPLISKLITHGPDRESALKTMGWALDNYVIKGVTNNVNLLRSLTMHKSFQAGDVTTKFLDEHYAGGYHGHHLSDSEHRELVAAAAAIHFRSMLRSSTIENQNPIAEDRLTHKLQVEGVSLVVAVNPEEKSDGVPVHISIGFNADGQPGYVVHFQEDDTMLHLNSDAPLSSPLFDAAFDGGEPRTLQIVDTLDNGYRLQFLGTKYDAVVHTAREHELAQHMLVKEVADTHNQMLSPMPGTVLSVKVSVGDVVAPGAEVCVMEAMKMQNVLRSTTAGKVKAIHVKEGQTVAVEELLVEFEPLA